MQPGEKKLVVGGRWWARPGFYGNSNLLGTAFNFTLVDFGELIRSCPRLSEAVVGYPLQVVVPLHSVLVCGLVPREVSIYIRSLVAVRTWFCSVTEEEGKNTELS